LRRKHEIEQVLKVNSLARQTRKEKREQEEHNPAELMDSNMLYMHTYLYILLGTSYP